MTRFVLDSDAVLHVVADKVGWDETYTAEYIALTQLQADAFVTRDRALARHVRELVTTATVDDLST